MKKIAEIKNELATELNNYRGLAETQLQEKEESMGKIERLERDLKDAYRLEEIEKQMAQKELSERESKHNRRFSFQKFLSELKNGNLTGLEAEVAEMGRKEFERQGLSSSGAVIPTAVFRSLLGNGTTPAVQTTNEPIILDPLKEKLAVAQMGATILSDLVGEVPIVSYSSINAGWGQEGAEAPISKTTFARASLTPKRNFVACAFSQDLLRQTSIDVERILFDLLMNARAECIEKAVINGAGTTTEPKGILNTAEIPVVSIGTNGGEVSWKSVVELETTVCANNADFGSLGYLTNSKVIGKLKTTERGAGNGRYLIEDSYVLNGYQVGCTNLVPSNLTKGTANGKCSALIFGNWKDLYIGQWGGIDVVVDPYTRATSGEVRFVVNSYNDVKVAEPKSFAVIKDIVTA